MKRIITIFVLCAGILMGAGAQDFTDRLQQKKPGQGTITVHQAADISQMVNKAQLAPSMHVGSKPATSATATSPTAVTATKPSTTTVAGTALKPSATTKPTTQPATDEEAAPTPVDNSKKMLRNGYKVNGYRVQAFAGGNSRKDRQQAERVGDIIKSNYPDVPVYVHFYSPRWICRVGNYRTYEEAHQMLQSVRKLGYTQATIVKGKITVQY